MVMSAVTQHPLQGDVVEMQPAIEEALGDAIEPGTLLLMRRAEKAAAEHGRERDGDHAGNQNGARRW